MIEKHIGEDHKSANCGARAAPKTLVFQSPRVAPPRTNGRILQLSSTFAHPGAFRACNSLAEKSLPNRPHAQCVVQNSRAMCPSGPPLARRSRNFAENQRQKMSYGLGGSRYVHIAGEIASHVSGLKLPSRELSGMSSPVLIQFGAPTLAALAGGAAGWWLRGLPRKKAGKSPELSQKAVTAQVLQKLQAAADTVRTCVEQHTTCIREIQSELNEPTSAEPVIITKLADSILESNKLAQHQCDDIRKALRDERQEIRDCITSSNGLLFTFASLDRQSQAYRKVLSSLEVLAAELSGEIKWHGQRLKKITGELEQKPGSEVSEITTAVTQILDATSDIERRVAKTEKRIAAHAESVEMQAILTHTDLLTSLPNRRALDAELQQSCSHSKGAQLATVILVDVDAFSSMNQQYGHQGGD